MLVWFHANIVRTLYLSNGSQSIYYVGLYFPLKVNPWEPQIRKRKGEYYPFKCSSKRGMIKEE